MRRSELGEEVTEPQVRSSGWRGVVVACAEMRSFCISAQVCSAATKPLVPEVRSRVASCSPNHTPSDERAAENSKAR